MTSDIEEFIEGIKEIFEESHFYCYTYDITQPVSKNIEQLKSNDYKQISKQWQIPLIQGYVQAFTQKLPHSRSKSTNNLGESDKDIMEFFIISRRQYSRGGPRYIHRGGDKEGNVANYVETEQIIKLKDQIFSVVQIRGSLPFIWDQNPLTNTISIGQSNTSNLEIFKKHFESLQNEYFTPYSKKGKIHLVNLLQLKNKQENKLIQNFEELKDTVNLDYLEYEFYDFHKNYQKLNQTVMQYQFQEKIKNFGYFHYDIKNNLIKNQQTGIFRTNCKDCLDRTNIYMMKIGILSAYEILRENFDIDIERDFIRSILIKQKSNDNSPILQKKQKILSQEEKYSQSDCKKTQKKQSFNLNSQNNKYEQKNNSETSSVSEEDEQENNQKLLWNMDGAKVHPFIKNFKRLWANNGDKVSLFYAGTDATTSILAREGDKSYFKILNKLAGYQVGIKRFVRGIFHDQMKQKCIKMILGRHDQTLVKERKQDIVRNLLNQNQNLFKFKIMCSTLNFKGKQFDENSEFPNIFEFDDKYNLPDIIVIGLQEIFIKKNNISSPGKSIEKKLLQTINSKLESVLLSFGQDVDSNQYINLTSIQRYGQFLCVYIKQDISNYVQDIQKDIITPTNTMQNSNQSVHGSLMVKIQINYISFCFINCCLGSSEIDEDVQLRWDNLSKIHQDGFQKDEKSLKIEFNDIVYLLGDFTDLDLKKYKDPKSIKDMQEFFDVVKKKYKMIDKPLFMGQYNEEELQIQEQNNNNTNNNNNWISRIYHKKNLDLLNQNLVKYQGIKSQDNYYSTIFIAELQLNQERSYTVFDEDI